VRSWLLYQWYIIRGFHRFLHASLQLAALCECTSVREVKETLASFPTDIEDLYLKTWQRIFSQKGGKGLVARNLLTWVVFGLRSLTIEELREAVAFHPDTHKFEQDRLVPDATLIGLCYGLVTVEKATRLVRLVRKSILCSRHTILLTSTCRLYCQGHLDEPHHPNTSTTPCAPDCSLFGPIYRQFAWPSRCRIPRPERTLPWLRL
jgi:hypothetical protein